MDLVYRAISIVSVILTVAMSIVMLVTLRRERRIGALSLLISAAISLVMLPLFAMLSGARLNLLVGVPLFILGLLVGTIRGFTTRLAYRGGQVVGKHALLFLVGWALSLILAQVVALAGALLVISVGLMPLYLSTGTQVAMSGTLFLRRLLLRRPPQMGQGGR